ncbi:MAG: hypothetical protein ACYC9J_01580 [Sulfuricaulis sp.]
MPNTNRKQVAHQLIGQLPDNATYDDMMRELYERQAIEWGLADSDADRVSDDKAIRAIYGLEVFAVIHIIIRIPEFFAGTDQPASRSHAT